MKPTNRVVRIRFILFSFLLPCLMACLFATAANAQSQPTTAFNYQGRLTDGTMAASGTYQMQFSLYDAASGGAQIGSTITNNSVSAVNGTFTVQLDFSPATPFAAGADRWLEIAVRKASDPPGFTTLTPRQQITSSPYSIRTLSAASADSLSAACVGCVTDAQINTVSGSKVTGTVANATNATTAGNVSGVVAIANGGTGSAIQNFVDLTTAQSVGGAKTFSSNITGDLIGNASTATTAATATTATNNVLRSGDTMTGALVLAGNPTQSLQAATKQYVDSADALKVNLSGGTMSGVLNMGNNKVTSLAAPTSGTDAANKSYVDAAAAGGNYAYAYDTTDQTAAFVAGLQDVTYNTNGPINGWVHPAGSATFTCPVTGLYLVQYYGRFTGTVTNIFTATMLATINFAEVAGSQSSTIYDTLSGATTAGPTVSKSFIISAAAGDVLRIQFAGGNTSTVLTVGTGSGTVKPSSTITITKIQ